MTTAKDILDEAAVMLSDRASDRDQPDGERSMGKIVECFNIATGYNLSERDGWLFMVFLKAVRAATTPQGKLDDYVDGAAYFGLAGEAALRAQPVRAQPVSAFHADLLRKGYTMEEAERFLKGGAV